MNTANQEQELCIACGLCCDGSLFEFTPTRLEEQDGFEPAEVGLFKLNDGGFAISQPCCHLHNKCCEIYQAVRPAICGKYKCKLLKNFLRDEITFSAALELIETTLTQRDDIREKLELDVEKRGLNLSDLFKAWTELQTQESQQTARISELSLEYLALQLHLARNFKK